ncbi:hypothetical protein A2U01_0049426, partial [Trifolium medium]|nr:hypothetical protein [Trifolium medium]
EEETITHCLKLCRRAVEIWTGYGFNDVQAMCHNVGMDNVLKILVVVVAEVGILAPLIM